jgi:uncharacterized DUF497 family protein
MVMFEWDEAKRKANIRKHGIDFEDVAAAWDGLRMHYPSRRAGEPRMLALGEINGRVMAVVYTLRDGAIRLISARRARHEEARAYYESDGGAGEEAEG